MAASRLVIARPARPPFDADFSRALAAALAPHPRRSRRAAARADTADEPRPPLQVEFAGGHRIAVETEAVVRRESILNTVGSLALILPLLFVVFRSLWLVAVGSLPSASRLVIVLGALGLTGATLSAAATASAAMLFGLGVDGVVLLYVAHALASSSGADRRAGVRRPGRTGREHAARHVDDRRDLLRPGVRRLPEPQQLGTLIGHSMVLCGVLTLVLVPALLPRRRQRRTRSPLTHAGAGRLGPAPPPRHSASPPRS